MYNEGFSYMNKSIQSDIFFYLKVQMAQTKIKLPIYSLISMRNIKDGNIINSL